jgi:hypothetical protein
MKTETQSSDGNKQQLTENIIQTLLLMMTKTTTMFLQNYLMQKLIWWLQDQRSFRYEPQIGQWNLAKIIFLHERWNEDRWCFWPLQTRRRWSWIFVSRWISFVASDLSPGSSSKNG